MFLIQGGKPLRGTVPVSGSKNAALPILVSALLTDEPVVVHRVPDLRDIKTILQILEVLGKKVERSGSTVTLLKGKKLAGRAPYDLVRQMRASFLVAGPLLARLKKVRVPMPGGCAIGLRPVDIHLDAFKTLGVEVGTDQGDAVLKTRKLQARTVDFKFPSVGATEHLMMTAALIDGTTTIRNAAREPEIADHAGILEAMGAVIEGAGTSTITVHGRKRLGGAEYTVMPDRIESGTFMLAAAATRGRVRVQGAVAAHNAAMIKLLEKAGATVRSDASGVTVSMRARPKAVSAVTEPYPGFPTDLQAPWMTLQCLAKGRSTMKEKVFENRFMHAAELRRMGADIEYSGDTATVNGVPGLKGAPVMASDLRAGAALVVAALAAKGETRILRTYHIERGYENLEAKLRGLGARIERKRG